MKWIRRGHYHLESECGFYRIAKTYNRGHPLYTLFMRPPNGWQSQQGIMGGSFHTADEAKDSANVAEHSLAEAKQMLQEEEQG